MVKTNRRMQLIALVIAIMMVLTTPVMAIQNDLGAQTPGDTGNQAPAASDINAEGEESDIAADEGGTADGDEINPLGDVNPAAENEDGEIIESPASYMKQNLLSLFGNGKIGMPEGIAEGAVTADNKNGGLKFSCTEGQYSTYRFQLKDKLDFSGNPVGRISVDGLADRKLKADVNIYLDDETDPVATIRLDNQMGKSGWSREGDKTIDVLKKDIKGQHQVSFGITVTGGSKPSTKMEVLLRSVEFVESSLPVLYFDLDESLGTISAMNSDPEHQTECYGDVKIQIPKGYESEYGGENKTKTYELEYIRGRGNSTWMCDKKPYKVKLDKKADLFGMGSNKHWILLANRYDNSLLRNKMTYWLGEQLGMPYTPQLVPVDLVLNNKYYGSYYLSEQVRIGTGRIDIDDLEDTPDVTTEPEITGGYLLSMGFDEESDGNHSFTTKRDHSFLLESPAFEDKVNETQFNYIKNYMQQTEDAIYGKDFKDENDKSYTEYLDTDAAADYFWIQEFSKNGDAYASNSTYLYKPRNDLLYWGPLWDFDYVAWGNLQYEEPYIEGFDTYERTWFKQMLRDPEFNTKVEARWEILKSKLEEITRDDGWLDQQEDILTISQRYDHEKWGNYFEAWTDDEIDAGEADTNRSYREEIEQLRSWINLRSDWVDENLNQLTPQAKTITFKVDSKVWNTMVVIAGDKIGKLPIPKAKKGKIFAGWYRNGFKIKNNEIVEDDMTLQAKFGPAKKVAPARDLYVRARNEHLYIDDNETYINYSVKPNSDVDRPVKWTSSDESVATVNDEERMIPHKTGVTTITGKLDNGVKTSFKLHIWSDDDEYDGEDIYMDKTKLAVARGNYGKITLNHGDPYGIEWQTFDNEIATVDSVGVVTGKKKGTTYVICNDSEGRMIDKCKVTVGAPVKSTYLRSVKGRKHSVKAKWKTRRGKVTGYQVQIAEDRGFTENVKTKTIRGSRKSITTMKNLSRNKTYYVSVRSYKTVNGNRFYAQWSKVKTVRTR